MSNSRKKSSFFANIERTADTISICDHVIINNSVFGVSETSCCFWLVSKSQRSEYSSDIGNDILYNLYACLENKVPK